MLKITKAHDLFFKSVIKDIRVAMDFFKNNLPKEALDFIDLNTLQLSPNSYVSPTLHESCSDVLYEVKMLEESGYLYLLCEHQSTIDNLLPFRILQYMVLIWADHIKKNKKLIHDRVRDKKLPLIIPLVVYNGKNKYDGLREIKELINAPSSLIEQFLFRSFSLVDTNEVQDEALKQQKWAGIVTFVMKHIHTREIYNYIHDILDMFKEIWQEDIQNSSQLTLDILQYILAKGKTQYKGLLLNDVTKSLPKLIGDRYMSIAEQLIQEGILRGKQQGIHLGITQGITQGINQGFSQGKAEMLLELTKHKFGFVAQKYVKLINQASAEQLSIWCKNLLSAKSIEAVFNETEILSS